MMTTPYLKTIMDVDDEQHDDALDIHKPRNPSSNQLARAGHAPTSRPPPPGPHLGHIRTSSSSPHLGDLDMIPPRQKIPHGLPTGKRPLLSYASAVTDVTPPELPRMSSGTTAVHALGGGGGGGVVGLGHAISAADAFGLQRRRSNYEMDMSQPYGQSQALPSISRVVRTPATPQLRPLPVTKDHAAVLPVKWTPVTHKISKAMKGVRVHTCNICKPAKTFSRAEHLRRHQLSHQTPAYACTYPGCERAFHRPDLLARHQDKHDQEKDLPSRQASVDSESRHTSLASLNQESEQHFHHLAQPAAGSPPTSVTSWTRTRPDSRAASIVLSGPEMAAMPNPPPPGRGPPYSRSQTPTPSLRAGKELASANMSPEASGYPRASVPPGALDNTAIESFQHQHQHQHQQAHRATSQSAFCPESLGRPPQPIIPGNEPADLHQNPHEKAAWHHPRTHTSTPMSTSHQSLNQAWQPAQLSLSHAGAISRNPPGAAAAGGIHVATTTTTIPACPSSYAPPPSHFTSPPHQSQGFAPMLDTSLGDYASSSSVPGTQEQPSGLPVCRASESTSSSATNIQQHYQQQLQYQQQQQHHQPRQPESSAHHHHIHHHQQSLSSSFPGSTSSLSYSNPLTDALDLSLCSDVLPELTLPLPLSQATRDAIPGYVDLYWQRYDPLMPGIHRASFEAQAEDILRCIMAAVATQFLPGKEDRIRGCQLHEFSCQEVRRMVMQVSWNASMSTQLMQSIILCEKFSFFRGRTVVLEPTKAFAQVLSRVLAGANLTDLAKPTRLLPTHIRPLQDQWREWVDAETQRRLLMCYYLSVKTAFLIQRCWVRMWKLPPLPQSPVPLSGPSSALWQAPSAEAWAALLAADPDAGVPKFIHPDRLPTREEVSYYSMMDQSITLVMLARRLPRIPTGLGTPAFADLDGRPITSMSQVGISAAFGLGCGGTTTTTTMDGSARVASEPDSPAERQIVELLGNSPEPNAVLALQYTSLHDLLAVSGDTWAYSKKELSPAAFLEQKQRLREWVEQPPRNTRATPSNSINNNNCNRNCNSNNNSNNNLNIRAQATAAAERDFSGGASSRSSSRSSSGSGHANSSTSCRPTTLDVSKAVVYAARAILGFIGRAPPPGSQLQRSHIAPVGEFWKFDITDYWALYVCALICWAFNYQESPPSAGMSATNATVAVASSSSSAAASAAAAAATSVGGTTSAGKLPAGGPIRCEPRRRIDAVIAAAAAARSGLLTGGGGGGGGVSDRGGLAAIIGSPKQRPLSRGRGQRDTSLPLEPLDAAEGRSSGSGAKNAAATMMTTTVMAFGGRGSSSTRSDGIVGSSSGNDNTSNENNNNENKINNKSSSQGGNVSGNASVGGGGGSGPGGTGCSSFSAAQASADDRRALEWLLAVAAHNQPVREAAARAWERGRDPEAQRLVVGLVRRLLEVDCVGRRARLYDDAVCVLQKLEEQTGRSWF